MSQNIFADTRHDNDNMRRMRRKTYCIFCLCAGGGLYSAVAVSNGASFVLSKAFLQHLQRFGLPPPDGFKRIDLFESRTSQQSLARLCSGLHQAAATPYLPSCFALLYQEFGESVAAGDLGFATRAIGKPQGNSNCLSLMVLLEEQGIASWARSP